MLLAWPETAGDFQPWYPEVEATYRQISVAISRRQGLIIACQDEGRRESILDGIVEFGGIQERSRFITLDYDDIWVRDTAPLTVEDSGGARLLDFRFNGWGGKYPCAHDAKLAERLYDSGLFGRTRYEKLDFVLEGGSIDSDGAGTVLTTRRCLLNPNRNPSFSESEIEDMLRRYLGVRRILWLGHGEAEGDDTDAHVDTLARFCDPATIAYTDCERPTDPQYDELKAMQRELQTFRTESGTPFRLVPLPIPEPLRAEDGSRLPATYANFLVINGAVLLPVYSDPNDGKALERLAAVFPGREIVPIDCRPLIRQFGSLHCMTMQFPKSVPISTP